MLACIGKHRLVNTNSIEMVYMEFRTKWEIHLVRRTPKGGLRDEVLVSYNDEQESTQALERIRSELREVKCLINLVPDE